MRWPAPVLGAVVRSGPLPGPGRPGYDVLRTLHGHEEPAGGCAGTLPVAPAHGDTLQPAAGPGDTKVETHTSGCNRVTMSNGDLSSGFARVAGNV